MPARAGSRVLQIHPTRACNLTCAHCYSLSGPGRRDSLDEDVVSRLLEEAAAEGYQVAGVSGGEPLMYEPLCRVLARAKRASLVTTVTTNGMLLTESLAADLVRVADLIALSLDGRPDNHNRVRRSPQAFDGLLRAGRLLRAAGARFGFITTLTRSTLWDLSWAAEFAASEGAMLFQAHALEAVGRGAVLYSAEALSPREMTVAYLQLQRLSTRFPQMAVQCDLTDGVLLRAAPERVLVAATNRDPQSLADIVSPIVLEADGVLVPLQYGFDRRHAFGSILGHSLAALKDEWVRTKLPAFTSVCRAAWAGLPETDDEWPIVNWYERTYAAAQSFDALENLQPLSTGM